MLKYESNLLQHLVPLYLKLLQNENIFQTIIWMVGNINNATNGGSCIFNYWLVFIPTCREAQDNECRFFILLNITKNEGSLYHIHGIFMHHNFYFVRLRGERLTENIFRNCLQKFGCFNSSQPFFNQTKWLVKSFLTYVSF